MSRLGEEKQRDNGGGQQATRTTLYTGHRATLVGLFEALENMVCPSGQSSYNCEGSFNQRSSAKWKILDHAMGFLLEKEAYLSKLLALKEVYLYDDGGPKSLEDVRDEYRSLYSKGFLHISRHSRRARVPDVDESDENSDVDSTDEETDELLLSQSSESSISNIQEFEGYLFFYSETLELLLRSGVLAPDQTGLSVVSEAISGLWSSLPQERRAEAQQHALDQSSVSLEGQSETTDSHLYGLNPSYAVEEDLLQDAYDVVQRDIDAASVNRPSVLQSCDYEKLRQIYKYISAFIQNHMAEEQELPQDLSQADEYEELLLRCSESFDEDF
uniref:Stra8 n=1 Tax=Silurus meridionalis TaxID=175797 RepID=R9RSM7_SILME|nr:Stra8 [Silurus meridionalis]